MLTSKIGIILLLIFMTAFNASAADKPLKIFILAGQSNMQGKAKVSTIERLNLTDDSRQMYQDMNLKDGLPSAVEGMFGVYFTAGDMTKGNARPLVELKGPFQPGYGEAMTENTTFGPDYTFGIYLRKQVEGPVLIIKTAWGGRDLISQFRPPSGGKLDKDKDGHGNPVGYYYEQVIKNVKTVLADPGKYHPDYKKEVGYEIAGFVWFQGFNDLIQDGSESYKATDTKPLFAEYGHLLACFIRDVRKDLDAPKMPFVIGVVGFGGPVSDEKDKQFLFRKAQEAPAALPEFKGNVTAIRTENCWDMELVRVENKLAEAAKKKALADNPKLGGKALQNEIAKTGKAIEKDVLTPDEIKLKQVGVSNEGFHTNPPSFTTL